MKNPAKAAEIAARNSGLVPYDRQTPEQRAELIGRLKLLLCTRVLSELLRENFKYIAGSVPDKPTSPEMKKLRQKLNLAKRDISDIIPKVKGLDALFTTLVTSNESTAEKLDAAAVFAYQFIENIHAVPVEKLERLASMSQDIINEKYETGN